MSEIGFLDFGVFLAILLNGNLNPQLIVCIFAFMVTGGFSCENGISLIPLNSTEKFSSA